MPWQEVVTMELRQQFVHDAQRRVVPVTELCAAYGISRKTGYKFLARYDALGAGGLADQSRRPHRSPTALDPVLLQRLLEAHHRHPYWGPRKLLRLVSDRWPDAPWPVRSTVARCFQHLGLVTARRRVRRPGPAGPPVAAMEAPNAVWTTDYKGQFKLGDGQYCFPLTVADGYSRMLLACQALTSTKLVEARPIFERLFREYGLPQRIRSDNGVPFGVHCAAVPQLAGDDGGEPVVQLFHLEKPPRVELETLSEDGPNLCDFVLDRARGNDGPLQPGEVEPDELPIGLVFEVHHFERAPLDRGGTRGRAELAAFRRVAGMFGLRPAGASPCRR